MPTLPPGSSLASENKRKNKSNQRERHRKRESKENRVKARNMRQRGKNSCGKGGWFEKEESFWWKVKQQDIIWVWTNLLHLLG